MHREPTGIEPELQSPPPREIRARPRERWVRRLFVSLGLIVPWLLTCLGFGFQADRAALIAHGVPTTGWVVEKHPAQKKDDSPRVRYHYQAADRTYVIWGSEHPRTFEKLQIGQEVPVLYLIDRPSVGALADDVRERGRYLAESLTLWIFSAILAAIMLPCWLWLETIQRRQRRLARDGIAVRTTSISVTRGQGYKGVQIWWVAYEFEWEGRTQRGRTSVEQNVAEALSQPDAQATVLCDPTNAKRFEIYPAIATLYRVLPPTPESTSATPEWLGAGTILGWGVLILLVGMGVAIARGTFDLGNRPVTEGRFALRGVPAAGGAIQPGGAAPHSDAAIALEQANQLVDKSNIAYEAANQLAAEATAQYKELFSDATLRGFPDNRPQLQVLAQQTVDLFGKAAEQYRLAANFNEEAGRQGIDRPRVEYLSLKMRTFRKLADANEAYRSVPQLVFDETIQDVDALNTRAGRLADDALKLFDQANDLSAQADKSYEKLKGEVK